MYFLFIDSGIEPGVVALIHKESVVDVSTAPSKDSSFPFLGVDQVLKRASIDLRDISALAVGVGPGSFTGIRTAVSVAQAISYARNIPLISIPSLFRSIPQENGRYMVALDARQGGAFCLLVQVEKERVLPDFSFSKLPVNELFSFATKHSYVLVADAILSARLTIPATIASDSCLHVGQLCYSRWKQQEYCIGTTPELYYLGATQAERTKS